jgi:hypothetical protein
MKTHYAFFFGNFGKSIYTLILNDSTLVDR